MLSTTIATTTCLTSSSTSSSFFTAASTTTSTYFNLLHVGIHLTITPIPTSIVFGSAYMFTRVVVPGCQPQPKDQIKSLIYRV